ncbi:histidine--tRNA ligase, partial [Candidatus Woesearchaeota archaeon]|nr:histidine--tRNA ligase [Candidatus Woesearchaeota archaeon]
MKMQTAKGVSDTPPEEKIIKNQVLSTLTQVFELYGFAPLETPVIERFDTLAAKSGSGEESDALKETFKLTDQGKRKLGLRFEFTTSLARYVAMNFNIKMPFKRYEFGPVFRDGPIKLGRYRQFWQCDADTIGTSSMLADAECVAILSTAFNKLDFKFEIKVNNRKILNGIMNQAGIKDQKEALISIDKLDKIGKEGVAKELKERGYKEPQIDKLFDLILGKVTLASLKKKITDEEGKEGLAELTELFSYVKKMGVKEAIFDISLARGQAYYTGTVIEAFLKKSKITSSIAGGGRYDDMIGGYMGGNRIVPAVGISFGIAPIMDALKMQQDLKTKTLA